MGDVTGRFSSLSAQMEAGRFLSQLIAQMRSDLMLKQTDANCRSADDRKSSLQSEKLGKEWRPVNVTDNIVPFRPRSHFQRAQNPSHGVSLARLEAENAALRNSAIELALEIQDLYNRRRYSQQS